MQLTEKEARMTAEEKRDSLKKEHEELSRLVEQEEQYPSPNQFYISELKKKKLQLKEQIEGIS
ncbi:MAG: DUF465 domain-containing protein [Rhodobacteraceae bacterium]|nr:DUF465 domain-containing protein [Paracoccaceae bacterium]